MAQAARITRYEAAKAKPRSQGMDIGSRRIEAGHKTSIFFGNDARVVNSQKQRETLKWQKDYQAPLTARGQLENEKRQGHGPIGSTTPRIGGFSKTFREPASLAGGASVNANIVRNHNATAARTMTTFSRVKLGSVNQSYEDFRKENVFPAPKCGKPAHQPKKINTGVVAGICKPFPSAMRFHHLSEQTMSAAKPRTASSLGNCNQERPNNGRLTRKKNFELGPQKTGPADFQPPPRVNRENEVAGVRRKANFLYRETEGGNTTPRTTPRVPPGGYSSFSMNHM
jgi:hypothetical protein